MGRTVRKRNPNPATFREPLTNVSVTIDSDHLAYLRADFQTVRDGKAGSQRRRSVHTHARERRVEDRRDCVHVDAGQVTSGLD